MEIEQTASPLETNAHANFPMAGNAAYHFMENGGGKHAHIDMSVANSACRVQCWDKVKVLDGSLENMRTFGYTKWTCSQSLTVLERTISDLQA